MSSSIDAPPIRVDGTTTPSRNTNYRGGDDSAEQNQPPASSSPALLSQQPPAAQVVVTQVLPNDVLMGRGAVAIQHVGNIRLRQELIAPRKREYSSTSRQQTKCDIARHIMNQVEHRNGRFLCKIKSPLEAQRLGVPEGTIEAYTIASDDVAIEKIKQALRDRDPQPRRTTHTDQRNAAAASRLLHPPPRVGGSGTVAVPPPSPLTDPQGVGVGVVSSTIGSSRPPIAVVVPPVLEPSQLPPHDVAAAARPSRSHQGGAGSRQVEPPNYSHLGEMTTTPAAYSSTSSSGAVPQQQQDATRWNLLLLHSQQQQGGMVVDSSFGNDPQQQQPVVAPPYLVPQQQHVVPNQLAMALALQQQQQERETQQLQQQSWVSSLLRQELAHQQRRALLEQQQAQQMQQLRNHLSQQGFLQQHTPISSSSLLLHPISNHHHAIHRTTTRCEPTTGISLPLRLPAAIMPHESNNNNINLATTTTATAATILDGSILNQWVNNVGDFRPPTTTSTAGVDPWYDQVGIPRSSSLLPLMMNQVATLPVATATYVHNDEQQQQQQPRHDSTTTRSNDNNKKKKRQRSSN